MTSPPWSRNSCQVSTVHRSSQYVWSMSIVCQLLPTSLFVDVAAGLPGHVSAALDDGQGTTRRSLIAHTGEALDRLRIRRQQAYRIGMVHGCHRPSGPARLCGRGPGAAGRPPGPGGGVGGRRGGGLPEAPRRVAGPGRARRSRGGSSSSSSLNRSRSRTCAERNKRCPFAERVSACQRRPEGTGVR